MRQVMRWASSATRFKLLIIYSQTENTAAHKIMLLINDDIS